LAGRGWGGKRRRKIQIAEHRFFNRQGRSNREFQLGIAHGIRPEV
jgi:hypothetical protein